MKSNYHAHTPRCQHAVGEEIEYVQAAIEAKFDVLGISDHTPWRGDVYRPNMRMSENELAGYVQAVRAAGEKYKDSITVLCGLEAEYWADGMSWLLEQKEKYGIDYLLLGNHFVGNLPEIWYSGGAETHAEQRAYVEATVKGMQTGAYMYLAHPDLFLAQVDDFDDYSRDCCRELIRAAKACNMPLEYNLEGLKVVRTSTRFHGQGYPASNFWAIAAEENAPCIIGVDAHLPESLTNYEYYEYAQRTLNGLGLKPIERIL